MTNKELQKRVEKLEATIARLTGRTSRPEVVPVKERADYIGHGSEKHKLWLGLRDATKEEMEEGRDVDGYMLRDITIFGLHVRPEFLKTLLQQKVSQLTSPVPVFQSMNPLAPNYAPPLWMPDGGLATGVV